MSVFQNEHFESFEGISSLKVLLQHFNTGQENPLSATAGNKYLLAGKTALKASWNSCLGLQINAPSQFH